MRGKPFQAPSSIYPITDTDLAGVPDHCRLVELLLRGGAKWIQIRDKGRLTDAQLCEQVGRAAEICRAAGCRLIVDDRVDLALAAGADGVHLGDRDLPVQLARRLLGSDRIIGYSTHSVEEAVEAERSLPVDYLGFGPVFHSETRRDPAARSRSPLGLEVLRQLKQSVSLPVVAIGGIQLENLGSVLAAGVEAAAMVSLLMTAGDIAGQMSSLAGEFDAIGGAGRG